MKNKNPVIRRDFLACPTGLEPATYGIGIRHSIQIELRADMTPAQNTVCGFTRGVF